MVKVRVVTDSTADVDDGEAAQLGLSVVPLNVHWNGETYQDKAEITIDEFYRKLREEKGTPKTSQPSSGQFEEVYRKLLEDADHVLSVHLSGKLSGTVNSAQIAAANVAPDRIRVVDTLTISLPLGATAMRLAGMARDGASFAECVAEAETMIPRLRLIVGLDTVEFLRRGGRIGRAQSLAANLLNIKLIIQILGGEVLPVDRIRTRAASVKRLAAAVMDAGPIEELGILYGDDRQVAEQLAEILRGSLPNVVLKTGRIGPVLGTHTGPGVFGAGIVLKG